jgi:hypothetical protein
MSTCKTIKESLEERYSLDGLDEFFQLEQTTPKLNTISYINIRHTESDDEIANVVLLITPYYIELGMLERISDNPEHKGVVRKVIQLVICKAVELDLPIHFHASPAVGKNIKHVSQNKTKLYKYYNNLGFTRVNQEGGDDVYYETTVETLKAIMKSWPSVGEQPVTKRAKSGGGSRKRKATGKRRTRR